MGKHEPGTPKFIANKMKAKGLQKLRWYCQMCQKQCRDENGFKCHTMSESHQRNLLMFADNSKKYMDEFSKDFLDGFMDLLRRQFGTKRVAANKVYQDYIADRDHIHMNSTKWVTLTGFVKWLGRSGKAVVDETEKGWFIQYIDRDPETLARQEKKEKKQKMDKDDEEKLMEFVEKQVQRAQQQAGTDEEEKVPSELVRADENEKISLQIKLQPPKPLVLPKPFNLDAPSSSSSVFAVPKAPKSVKSDGKRKRSEIEEIIKEEKAAKLKKEDESWLSTGIVVKIITSKLGEKYENQKCIIENVDSDFRAVVRVLSTGHKLKLDQAHLQTVIPQLNKKVKVLTGKYKHQTGILKRVLIDKFCGVVEVKASGSDKDYSDVVLLQLPYEHFSKLMVE